MYDIHSLSGVFSGLYGSHPDRVYSCPGRVNLIGEHLDYNGGHVLPGAISLAIYSLMSPRLDDKIFLVSLDREEKVAIDISEDLKNDPADGWANYPKGVVKHLLAEGYNVRGLNILYAATLPSGSGLSSSAALEVLTAFTILDSTDQVIDNLALAELCRDVENDFIGVECGIMDHFAVVAGKKERVIKLNCSNMQFEHLPFESEEYSVVIMDTNRERRLSGTEYNERRAQCEKALGIIQRERDIAALSAASIEEAESIADPILKRRARHVVREEARVLDAAAALKKRQFDDLGRLMYSSHRSLRDDFEVSTKELDILVEAAMEIGVGARMTGAGFGGCAIALVANGRREKLMNDVSRAYEEQTGIKARMFHINFAEGVRRLS